MTSRDIPPTLDALLSETEWIRALAHRLIVDPGTADDVAQDATVIALTKPPSSAEAARGWLRRVVGNVASNVRRSETRRGFRERAVAASEVDEATDEVVARWEIRRRVVEAVLALDEPYRTTILLRFFDGLTAADAAAQLRVPLETVRTRTRRGLELLRGRLAHLDDGRGRRGFAALLLLAGDRGGGLAGMKTGGAAMATSTKWMAAAALVVAGLGATWVVTIRELSETAAAAPPPPPDKTVVSAKPGRTKPAVAAIPSDGVDLAHCDRERDLHGIVVDRDGKPVAGAKVISRRNRPWGVTLRTQDRSDSFVDADATVSKSDGSFALRLARGDEVALRVDAEGFALWESVDRQAGERVTIRLARPVTLDVVVHSADGRIVAGADVRVSIEVARSEHVDRHAKTDASGRARFERMPRGSGGTVRVADYAVTENTRFEEDDDAETQTFVVTLPATRTVRGTVVDAATKVGIAGAAVTVGDRLVAVRTDPLGRFEIARFENRPLHAEATGYARAELKVDDDVDVAFSLERAVRLVGRVVDVGGEPLKDADVALIGNSENSLEQTSSGGATTGADGRFVVEGLLPGRAHLLRVQAAGHALVYRAAYTAQRGAPDFDLGDVVVGELHVIPGSVVDADGKPTQRVRVGLGGPDGDGDYVIHLHRVTDDLGRFAFSELPPGRYAIGADLAWKNTFEVTVPTVGDAPTVTIRAVAPQADVRPTIPVTVRVTDEAGAPIAGAIVSIGYVANGVSKAAPTDARGMVTASAEFWPSSVYVSPPADDAARWLRTVTSLRPGLRDALVVLRRAARIEGTVLAEDGAAVKHAWVEAFDGSRQIAGVIADDEGRFALSVPVGVHVDLQASLPHAADDRAPAKRTIAEAFDVAAGATSVALRMVRTPTTHALDIEVVDTEGAPMTGTTVTTQFVGGDWTIAGAVGADGHVALEALPRSSAVVLVHVPGARDSGIQWWGPALRRVRGDIDSVRIVVGKPRPVRGRVRLEDGAPAAGAFVAGTNASSVADGDGRFTLDVAPDVEMPLAVHANPASFDPQKPVSGYDLLDADDRELEIVLHAVPKR